MSTLREQLYADGEYFKRLLSLIPGNYCVGKVEHNALETDTGRTSGGQLLSFCRSRTCVLKVYTFYCFRK